MRLTIVAATGGIGRRLLEQALAAGHRVTVVVRDPTKLARELPLVVPDRAAVPPGVLHQAVAADGAPAALCVATADLAEPDAGVLEAALDGAEAVLSALGPAASSEIGIAARGTREIVRAMHATGVRRIVAVSAAPVATVPSPGHTDPPKHDPGDGFFMRHLLSPVLKAVLGRRYVDLAQMEDVLRASDLEWTIVRPPQLTDGRLSRRYRTAFGMNVRRGLRVSRADVADLMLRALEDPRTIRRTVGIAN
jgi:putative NADH-flavin reductase